VDDVLIGYQVKHIDGPGDISSGLNTIANSAPTTTRGSGCDKDTTVAGVMTFDKHDVEDMIAEGIFSRAVLHEMAHVLGFGTTWDEAGCVKCSFSGGDV
ncbi:unnamed protein product, partial [Phaeothamnion confervicola]